MTKELIEEMKNVLTEQKNQMLESLAEKNADFKKLVKLNQEMLLILLLMQLTALCLTH